MAEAKYLHDSYIKIHDAKVVSIKDGKYVILDDTIFYPTSGGQQHDTGKIRRKSDGKIFDVVYVGKFEGQISHEIKHDDQNDGLFNLNPDDEVVLEIDWNRRYKHMRMHTAAHIVTRALHNITGAMITGNQLEAEESRVDGNFDYKPEIIEQMFKEANEIVEKDLPISIEFMSREEAEKQPLFTRLAKGLPSEIKNVRMLAIGDYDVGADGGTHVKSTKEVGKIIFSRYNSKGKDNKRVYFKLE